MKYFVPIKFENKLNRKYRVQKNYSKVLDKVTIKDKVLARNKTKMKIKRMILVKIRTWNSLLEYINLWKLVERMKSKNKNKNIMTIIEVQINSTRNMCKNNQVLQICLKLNNPNHQVINFYY